MAQLCSKAGMHVFTKWFKPALYNAGAAPQATLGDGSARVREELLKLAAKVLRAHDVFGLRTTVDAAMTDAELRKHFGLWLETVLNTADKVAFYSADFKRR